METIVDLVRASVRRFPDRVALAMRTGIRNTRLTYADLDRRASAYARLLEERGVGHGDRVLIWAPNQPDWVAAMLGVYLVGGVMVPLDIRSTREFVTRVIGQTEPKLAFAGTHEAETLRAIGMPFVDLAKPAISLDGVAPCKAMPGDLAAIIYTSGTTGDPKGVMLSHANVASNARAALQVIDLDPGSRIVSILPLSHMFEQIGGCIGPLAVGGTVTYPTSRQPASLLRTMAEARPTYLILVPQALRLFLNGIEREAAARGRMQEFERLRKVACRLPMRARRVLFRPVLKQFGGSLEFIASGGAPLDPALRHAWELMGISILEGYGATECSPIITISPRDQQKDGSCGRTLPGQEVRIAPDGEILSRGLHIFAGYWRNEAATAAVMADGWYRTGDLGVLDRDGYIYIKGRKKDLIVLSDGQNVYPEDVEREIVNQPGIRDAAVFGIKRGDSVRIEAVIVEARPGSAAMAVRNANERLDARQQILGWSSWPEEDFPRTNTLKVRRGPVLEWILNQTPIPHTPAADPGDALARIVVSASTYEGHIEDTLILGSDLRLDSLGRVELLSAIEEELGVFIDDTEIGPLTSVGELRLLVERGRRKPELLEFPTWPRSLPVRLIRRAFMGALILPMLRAAYRVDLQGAENLHEIDGPAIVISNHNMHLDQTMILLALGRQLRHRIAIAAAADFLERRWNGFIAGCFANAFPFVREGSGVRESLENVAKLLDQGWHVLIFPEGQLTEGGPMQPFKSGIGLLAAETGVQVLPMRVDIIRRGIRDGRWFPHPRGHVRVVVGRPLRALPEQGYAEATATLEEAVRRA